MRPLAVAAALILGSDGLGSGDEAWLSKMQDLKSNVLPYLPKDVVDRADASTPLTNPPPRQQKINHFVMLYMENHAADNYFGCMDLPGFDGIKGHTVPKDPSDPSKGVVNITCGAAPYVCKGGPSYDTYAGKFPPNGQANNYPYSPQDDKYSALHGASEGGTAVTMFAPEQIPIKKAIAENFGVFNKMYTAVASASSPNHLFTQSATSCGMQTNTLYNDCGGKDVYFPQPTIWDSLRLHNVSFGLYINSTCGLDGKPCKGEDPHNPDSASAISTPDVAMSGVARHQDRFFSQTLFYEQAANGTLPAVTWLLPAIQACDHPCHDIAKGERILKDVYEAVRAGPGWENTMLVVAYDDAGGYYDHVVPPSEGVPADESPCKLPGVHPKCGEPFDFRRLGLRTSAMLISPWVAKGTVFQEPKQGPFNTSQFELTSVPATIKNLFNLSFFLTHRDRWAGNFEELLLDAPRADAPMTLPEAPEPATPWDPVPPTGFRIPGKSDDDDDDDASPVPQVPAPQHCSSWHGGNETLCKGVQYANLKQRRQMRLFSAMTNSPEPDADKMSFSEADQWIATRWREWVNRVETFVNYI